MNKNERIIRQKIRSFLKEFSKMKKAEKFAPNLTTIQYAGAVYDEREVIAMVDAILDGWFGLGKKAREFELMFSRYLGVARTVLTNSGSSANLLALAALKSPYFRGRLENGDEIITPAMTFPTTFNSIIQNNLTPVLLDVKLGTYNIDPDDLKRALSEKTRGIFLPHAFGIPNQMDIIMDFARDHDLYVIEDNCDALGSTYKGKKTGSFGILSTCSFFPAHHITMGEGGSVSIRDDDINLYRIIKSLRDWGRACYCEHDEMNPNGACGKRFDFEISGIPYDHRYIYTHIGYNLKPLEFQAAMGIEQLKKLPEFIKKRKKNFRILYDEFSKYEKYFILPEEPPGADVSWFCFPLTIRDGAPFGRKEIISFFERNKIQTRLFFAGNIIRQPAYREVRCRIVGELKNCDKILKDSFFIGVYPGITEEKMNYILEKIEEFMRKF
ncbi:MAG: lipopolysaccharide biosynthesis protein RfbH [Candidatus Micrarchaeia archaeon]